MKKHKWFRGLDFAKLYTRELDAPFVPVVTDSSDTRNFEDYPDSAGDDPGEGLPKETDAELFGMF